MTMAVTRAQWILTTGLLLWQSENVHAQGSQASGFAYLDNACPVDSGGRQLQRGSSGSNGSSGSSGATTDTLFCNMLFRKISSPEYLANWRAIQARPSDVWFASLPPSGNAKTPAIQFIGKLIGGTKVSGHTEFYNWLSDPTGSGLAFGGTTFDQFAGTRVIGTHVPFEWLPTSVLNTPHGQNPCKVVYLVREPEENLVAAAMFEGSEADITPWANKNIAAAMGNSDGELGVPNRGYAGYANGYAAAVGGGQTDVVSITSNGGPEVFLLSQARLANSSGVGAEATRLAAFLGLTNYVESDFAADIATLQQGAASALGDVSQLTADQAREIDETFAAPRVDPRVTALYTYAGGGGGGGGGSGDTTPQAPQTSSAHPFLKPSGFWFAISGAPLLFTIGYTLG